MSSIRDQLNSMWHMSTDPSFFNDIPDDYKNSTLKNEVFLINNFGLFMIHFIVTANISCCLFDTFERICFLIFPKLLN